MYIVVNLIRIRSTFTKSAANLGFIQIEYVHIVINDDCADVSHVKIWLYFRILKYLDGDTSISHYYVVMLLCVF